ncbi:MAG: SAM-dependent methyltransferase [Acidobacteria bacterium]|nr:SAM-dependent methyltransferase [Acidobacteriota bacterium]
MTLRELLIERIRATGPLTFAEFTQVSLYHPQLGYYARSAQRSGIHGDFFTSVDVGPVFGELLAAQLLEMSRLLRQAGAEYVDLVEAGAGNGRLSADILGFLRRTSPGECERIRLHLVEASDSARRAQAQVLGSHSKQVVCSSERLPEHIHGVVFANELLDAMPAHLVLMREDGLRELVVDLAGSRLVPREATPSRPEIAETLARTGARLGIGWRAEVSIAAIEWMRDAAASLDRGFLLIIDYGHEAPDRYSAGHASGTLRSYRRHMVDPPPARPNASGPADDLEAVLNEPGERDLTAHVDFTAVGLAAEGAGLQLLGFTDQTYFLLGLGLAQYLGESSSASVSDLRRRLALKTLMLPGGLGSTHKVMVYGKGVGRPELRGFSYRMRIT